MFEGFFRPYIEVGKYLDLKDVFSSNLLKREDRRMANFILKQMPLFLVSFFILYYLGLTLRSIIGIERWAIRVTISCIIITVFFVVNYSFLLQYKENFYYPAFYGILGFTNGLASKEKVRSTNKREISETTFEK